MLVLNLNPWHLGLTRSSVFCITQELRKLWDSRDTAGLFGPDNTLLIDDSTYKVSEREERTLACYVMALHTGSHTAAPHTHRLA